jgi:hypothetical protein
MIDARVVGIAFLANGHARLTLEPAQAGRDGNLPSGYHDGTTELFLLMPLPDDEALFDLVGQLDAATGYPVRPVTIWGQDVLYIGQVEVGQRWESGWFLDAAALDKALAAAGLSSGKPRKGR